MPCTHLGGPLLNPTLCGWQGEAAVRGAELAVQFDHSPRLRPPSPTSSALASADIPLGKKCFNFSFPFFSSQLEYLSVALSFSFPLTLLALLPLQTNVLLFQGSHGSISFQGLHITTSVTIFFLGSTSKTSQEGSWWIFCPQFSFSKGEWFRWQFGDQQIVVAKLQVAEPWEITGDSWRK